MEESGLLCSQSSAAAWLAFPFLDPSFPACLPSYPHPPRSSWPSWGKCVLLRVENIPCNKKMKQKHKENKGGFTGLGKAPFKDSHVKCWDTSGRGIPGMTFLAPAASLRPERRHWRLPHGASGPCGWEILEHGGFSALVGPLELAASAHPQVPGARLHLRRNIPLPLPTSARMRLYWVAQTWHWSRGCPWGLRGAGGKTRCSCGF